MITRAIIFIVFLFVFTTNARAQYNRQIENIRHQFHRAVSDSDKVVALGKLADYFYIYKLDKQGDSALTEQLRVAELSGNPNLIMETYFGVAITSIGAWTNKESYDRTITFLQQGLEYATSKYAYDFMAIGYTRLASIYRKKGDLDKSFRTITQALSILPDVNSDSVKSTVYIELGNTYKERGEAVPAFTNYNSAFDIAFNIKNVRLQSTIYHHFFELYRSLRDDEAAKRQLFLSVELNKANNNHEGLADDYVDLARLTSDTVYAKRAIALGDSLGFDKQSLRARVVMLTHYMLRGKSTDFTLHYLQNEPNVRGFYENVSSGKLQWLMGQVYLYAGKADSAIAYFQRAENDLVQNFDLKTTQPFYHEFGDAYKLKHDYTNAIKLYRQSLNMSRQMNEFGEAHVISTKLSELYESMGDYVQALTYSKEAKKNDDILQAKKAEKNIALLGVERERKKHELLLKDQEEKSRQKRNIQLMAITVTITIVFGIMLLLGMFSVSKLTIKMMGYFAFISLFEFIVIVIETFVFHFSHTEPLKLWVMKILLIAILVPIQHFLEHRMIKFLESRKLLEVRTKFSVKNFSIKKWWYSRKPREVDNDNDIEQDTAVL